MFRQWVILALFICTAFFTLESAASPLVLDNTNKDINSYSLAGHVYLTPDPTGEFGIQDIITRYNNNVRGERVNTDHITLGNADYPFWIVFDVDNQSGQRNWILDFGDLSAGRSGLIRKMLVYDNGQKDFIFNGEGIAGKSLPMTIGTKALVIVYIYPASYKPVTLSLSLKKTDIPQGQDLSAQTIPQVLIDTLVPVLFGICCVILLGLTITQSLSLFLLLGYFVLSLLWVACYEYPVYSGLPGGEVIGPSLSLLLALLLAVSSVVILSERNYYTRSRIILLAGIFGAILVFICVYLVSAFQPSYRLFIQNGAAVLLGLLTLGVTLNQSGGAERYLFRVFVAVIVFFIAGVLSKFAMAAGLLSPGSFYYHSDLLLYYPKALAVFVLVVFMIRYEEEANITDIMRQSQKTQSLLKAQKNKEKSDHSRLLRVIEREREIMEELRGREAERTEEMRLAKISADEANQAKSAFLAVVSHEIRTPMTGVMGMIRMLESTNLTEEQKNYVMTIKDSGDAMVSLLNDILDFSKIQSGGLELEHIAFDPYRVANGVIMLMKGHAEQKNLDLRLEIDPSIPTSLYGDPTRLRQVLLNLVSNALKFTEAGHVALYLKCACDENEQNCAITFRIEDTGIGISEEAQKSLFKPFSQANSSISRKYGGTGLGLTICQKLVEAMGGQIAISSTAGKGASFFFTVTFPKDTDHSENTENPAKALKQARPIHALIADDNEVNLKVITAMLAQKGHSFETTTKGGDVLDILTKNKDFDAIFLDIEMPDINGKDVAAQILAREEFSKIPLIALTGNVTEEDIKTYNRIGFAGYLPKPINPERLYDMLCVLGNVQPASENQYFFLQELKEDDLNDDSFNIKKQTQKKPANMISLGKTLDEDLLQGLKQGLGKGQTASLLEDLFEKADEIMVLMKGAIDDGKPDVIFARAHEMKGMAGNFGLRAVSEKSAEIESLHRDTNAVDPAMTAHYDDLATLLERSRFAIDVFLKA